MSKIIALALFCVSFVVFIVVSNGGQACAAEATVKKNSGKSWLEQLGVIDK